MRLNMKILQNVLKIFFLVFIHSMIISEGLFAEPTTLVFPPFGHCYGIRKGTPRHLWMFLGDKTRFDNPQGIAAVKLKSNDEPGKKDDDELTVYGVNANRHQIIYNTSLLSLAIYGKHGTKIGEFKDPKGIAADEDGNVFVADTGNNRIVHLKNENNKLTHVKFIGKPGHEPDQLYRPNQVALTTTNELYITDSGNQRIQVFSANGDYLRTIPANNQQIFINPDGIAVVNKEDNWNRYKNEFFCVIDSLNSRIRKFSLTGDFLAQANIELTGFNKGFLAYLAIDYYDNVWVTDTFNHTVYKFDKELNFITSFGSKGDGDYQFDEPRGITIWKRFGQVFVAEKKSAQYYWVGVDFDRSSAKVTNDSLIIEYTLTETAKLSGKLLKDEELVYTFFDDNLQVPGNYRFRLPIKDFRPGEYKLEFQAIPTYSSRKYFKKEWTNLLNFGQ